MGKSVAVLGAGSWGTALAVLLAEKGYRVRLWARRPEAAEELRWRRENLSYLPGIVIPFEVAVTSDLAEALHNAEVVVLSVPSHALRPTLRLARSLLPRQALLVNTAKGLEADSLRRLSQVVTEELGEEAGARLAVLSGPSHAEEVSRRFPTAVVVASQELGTAEAIQDLFSTSYLRVYTNPDLVGVELGGALKNVIALASGMADGLGFGDNTRAAIITRGLAEIARLGVRLGANPLTFAGLAGLGDLVVTCTSPHSRNRQAGLLIGRGHTLEQALAQVGMVVEGVRTTRAACELADRMGVEMPISREVYRVLFEGRAPQEGVARLMLRNKAREVEDLVPLFTSER
ncbi:MAG: NAD(P)H-dependent glycerol-3-phosphate dehydrogenase [Moorellales bacterium]